MRYSANLGFLYRDLDPLAAVRAAKAAGFDAVEFHDQLQTLGAADLAAIKDQGLPVLGLNLAMGPTSGRAAIAGQEAAFRADFAKALEVAEAVGAQALHVVSGRAEGAEALEVYEANLAWALDQTDLTLLLEPICPEGIAGYFLNSLALFEDVATRLAAPNLRLMADYYHLAALYGADFPSVLAPFAARIGHAQLAAPVTRTEPWPEALPAWQAFKDLLAQSGCTSVGLEYRPSAAAPEAVLAALRKA